ncbi:MAG: flagellar biosynthesis protein FlgA [Bacteroidetes bacterium 4572_77]|nr:MAG: flagellar biosynthesis protein FlgA [Bacteroidetes bacterium 4572_77]
MAYTKRHIVLLIVLLLFVADLNASRIKDVAEINGTGKTAVVGYGLVTGLNNTGDNLQASHTTQSIMNMLKRFGITVPEKTPRFRNVAAVMVTADIESFLKTGQRVDVQVSSVGDATSLQGGILLMTPVLTAKGKLIGYAQGAISVGGFGAQSLGSMVRRNFITTGRIPNGLKLEIDFNAQVVRNGVFQINLRQPDFTSANNVTDAINNGVAGISAVTTDAGSIEVTLPANMNQAQVMQTIATIEGLQVDTDPSAKVVINERTGTIVVGANVELHDAVIAHSGLEIRIEKQVLIPQPAPFRILPPWVVKETAELAAEEDEREQNVNVLQVTSAGTPATVTDVANALNALDIGPRDLIAIFQALKESGSLKGELVIQ